MGERNLPVRPAFLPPRALLVVGGVSWGGWEEGWGLLTGLLPLSLSATAVAMVVVVVVVVRRKWWKVRSVVGKYVEAVADVYEPMGTWLPISEVCMWVGSSTVKRVHLRQLLEPGCSNPGAGITFCVGIILIWHLMDSKRSPYGLLLWCWQD
jgi:hypothetical protein